MTMKKIIAGLIFTVFFAGQIFGQNVGISETPDFSPNENAILELKSTLKGFLPPRLTSTQRKTLTDNGIGDAEKGLMIYNTTRMCMEFWTGTKWTSSDPAGTIKAFGGSSLPDGWLWCDGSTVSRTTYPDLLTAIDANWGHGNTTTTFNLPDLRGHFLRGVDNMDNTVGTGGGTANIDPNVAGRTAKYTGGNTASNVGSYQDDAFQFHEHKVYGSNNELRMQNLNITAGTTMLAQEFPTGGEIIAKDIMQASGHSAPLISEETRPKNAYVNYIIKY